MYVDSAFGFLVHYYVVGLSGEDVLVFDPMFFGSSVPRFPGEIGKMYLEGVISYQLLQEMLKKYIIDFRK